MGFVFLQKQRYTTSENAAPPKPYSHTPAFHSSPLTPSGHTEDIGLGSSGRRLFSSPEEFGRELRVAAAIKWYEMQRVSQGKTAEIAGLSRSEFIEALGRYGMSLIQGELSELESEVTAAMGGATGSPDTAQEGDE